MMIAPQRIHIIGLGEFGATATHKLAGLHPLVLVDPKPGLARDLAAAHAETDCLAITENGICWLKKLLNAPHQEAGIIVPTLPLHLAAEVIMSLLARPRGNWQNSPSFPNCTHGPAGDYFSSLAPDQCPAECPGPPTCYHGPKRQSGTLSRILANSPTPHSHLVIESRQLAPGVGGFALNDLRQCVEKISANGKASFILTTASSCHGVSTWINPG